MAYVGNLGFNQMSPYGGCGCAGGMQGNPYQQGFMMGQQMAQMQQMMQMMMGMMQMMMQMQGMGGGCNPMMNGMNPMMNGMGGIPGMGGGFPAMGGGFPGMGGGIGNYMGGGMPFSPQPFGPSGYPGGGMPYGGGYSNGVAPMMPGNYGNSGSAAVSLGQRFLGQNSINVRGQLPHFTAAGGQTNNCADFVSSCLESTGGLQGHHVGVRALEQALLRQGYRRIPASMAKPGDVWMNPSRGHTELVATPGATQLLGSNNDRPGHQVISQKPNRNPEGGVYYSRG